MKFPATRVMARFEAVQNGTARSPRVVNHFGEIAHDPQYHALIQNSSEMMFLLDAGGHIVFAGPSCTQILGYAPEELLGRSCFAMIHPGELGAAAAQLSELISAAGETRKAEFRLLAKDGSWRWIEVVGSNLLKEPKVHSI